ncbi:putative dsRNA-binding protein [Paenibacillus allorhizosphaerae]|uniref:Ribonuclease 3 n=1 Tax=Paenibacillus allorhizosphaerae TaxID=2849866 RepID=A0ABN7TWE8_9BACL|nr:putative dsRNA-binding protein [Paenibacillus allorhizosphaerae]CAG7658407.1 Ribonuclease 3 [Paenibacillus allorhizosphaerae]
MGESKDQKKSFFKGQQLLQLLEGQCSHITAQELDAILHHSSALNEIYKVADYEKTKAMAFAGKSLMQTIMCYICFFDSNVPDKNLSPTFQASVEPVLTRLYKHFRIDEMIYLGKGEENNRYSLQYREVLLAIIQHIYIKEGFYTVLEIFIDFATEPVGPDYKSMLLEYVNKHKGHLVYKLINETGPDHQKMFEVEVSAFGTQATGIGSSKKEAEKQAAQSLFNIIGASKEKSFDMSLLRSERQWHVSHERARQLQNYVSKQHTYILKNLSIYVVDAVFSHKSYFNEHPGIKTDSYDMLAIMGSCVLNHNIDAYLLANFDTMCGGRSNQLLKIRGELVCATFLAPRAGNFLGKQAFQLLRASRGQDKNVPSIMLDIFKALLGAVFLSGASSGFPNPFEKIQEILASLSILQLPQVHTLDYRSTVNSIANLLKFTEGLETRMLSKKAHEPLFEATVTISHPIEKTISFQANGQGNTSKIAARNACQAVFAQLSAVFNLTQLVPLTNSTRWDSVLQTLLEAAFKPSGIQAELLTILGGLCLKKWDESNARSILENLLRRSLAGEAKMVYYFWLQHGISQEQVRSALVGHQCFNQVSDLLQWEKPMDEAVSNLGERSQQISFNDQQINKIFQALNEYEAEGEVQYSISTHSIAATIQFFESPDAIKALEAVGCYRAGEIVSQLKSLQNFFSDYRSGNIISGLIGINDSFEQLCLLATAHWIKEFME